MKRKVFILLPDGVGLRNFVYTSFYNKLSKHYDVVFWNNTSFPLKKELNIDEIKLSDHGKTHIVTNLLKTAKNRIELKLNSKKFNDKIYLSYIFYNKNKNLKSYLKNRIVDFLSMFFCSAKGVIKINKWIDKLERTTILYKESYSQLQKHKPDLVFCTNQRHTSTIAPMLAAKDLNIITVSFIFSWDNLPKATLVLNPDYYFVWSDFMKNELIKYYPQISESQIKITGTPQFELHHSIETNKEDFFKEYNLDLNKDYICFSGDDITTSPYDEYYLEDLALAVMRLNKNKHHLGIIYRKNPTDNSNRHIKVLEKYKDIIVSIEPHWVSLGSKWSNMAPAARDNYILTNSIKHCVMVINLGSSMVFDAVSHNITCAYLNYNPKKGDVKFWDVKNIYRFIHFRSMPSKKAVIWINHENDFDKKIEDVLNNNFELNETKKWFHKINKFPKESSDKMVTFIQEVLK